jgi:acyl carrier protein
MDRSEILKVINDIFIETLDNEEIELSEDSQASDVEDWDSLSHIQLVVEVEKHFKIRFTSKEIQSWGNVGDMIDSVVAKL